MLEENELLRKAVAHQMKGDIPKNIQERMRQLAAGKSAEERLDIGFAMFAIGKDIIKAELLVEAPSLNEAQIRARTFLRLYGTEFPKEEIDKIMKRIPNMQLDEEWYQKHFGHITPRPEGEF